MFSQNTPIQHLLNKINLLANIYKEKVPSKILQIDLILKKTTLDILNNAKLSVFTDYSFTNVDNELLQSFSLAKELTDEQEKFGHINDVFNELVIMLFGYYLSKVVDNIYVNTTDIIMLQPHDLCNVNFNSEQFALSLNNLITDIAVKGIDDKFIMLDVLQENYDTELNRVLKDGNINKNDLRNKIYNDNEKQKAIKIQELEKDIENIETQINNS